MAMASMTASPIPSTSSVLGHQPQPRITLRPSSSTGSASASARISPTPTPTPSASRQDSEEDELRDDELPKETPAPSPLPTTAQQAQTQNQTPLLTTTAMKAPLPPAPAAIASGSTHSPSPRAGGYSTGGGKSRKSSCELCHHRKIKCDQQRPSCSSCIRKGHFCKYAEEAEQTHASSSSTTSAPRPSLNQRAMSVTIVNASDPSIKYTMPVPAANPHTPSLKVGYGQSNGHPEWKVAESGSGEKKKSAERRERIVSGFDSDSEDEDKKEREGSVKGRGKGDKDLDGELAALVEGEMPNKQEEIDELEDDTKESSVESEDNKRGMVVDDDLSGELLELASAPPKKKKKPTPSASALTITAQQGFSRPAPKPIANRSSYGRSSLPAGVLPPTPATSTAALSFTNRAENARYDPYSTPLQNLATSLPSQEMQQILFNTFFNDPFLNEGISLLQPQYLDDFKGLLERKNTRFQAGDATTLANAFAFLATALRILPDETSKLLLASQVYTSGNTNATSPFPRSLSKLIACQPASMNDVTPLDQRYLDLALVSAQIAEQTDPPSVMLVMLKLVLYRFCMLGHRRDKIVLAGMWLAQAVKVAQALGMGKEWEGLTQGERELRRRVMWSLYVADRHHSFETSFPYTIMDAHQGIHLPSPMAETDLYKLRPDIRELPAHATELAPTACTALFIHTHLARRITPILDSFATISAANTPHDLVLRFDASLDAFQEALPPYFRLFPLTETRFDSTHPYLAAHRIRLHATLLSYRIGVHRTHLLTYLIPSTPSGIRQVIAQVCLSSLRVQRSSKMLDPKITFRLFNPMIVFENAATLALIMYVEKLLNTHAEGKGSYTNSNEWMTMRSGLAEANELLDNVIPGEGLTYARKAVAVLRELMSKVDMPVKVIPSQAISNDGEISPLKTTIPLSHPHTHHQSPSGSGRERSVPPLASTSISPKSNDKHSISASMSPQKSTSSSRQQELVNNIMVWLDELRKGGINLEVLLREPEWVGGWERIVVGM
ncbi:hypothetical protein I302_101918 [Kwoniella bestiolae CBS 10118]|uniref:Zn(2)-C6 fungal-type domain-containing protein n=1 Tax=Kwoniella bestiolae CBS 10118 TaxID=1296100 RepID=A0A1B9GDJ7_9TREE|nr:hypothetical protein I302_00600 [Kwoniella bestiolae CBS 10118]OCF29106.1 hypothetical protein I302_00600 [Kwoniella bestiolae CBS 10118]